MDGYTTAATEQKKSVVAVIWAFIVEHWTLALWAVLLGVLFRFVEHFAELVYSTLKLVAVVFSGALILNIVFKDTIRRYINEGQLVTDFHGLEPTHKVYFTFAIISVLLLVSALCFVHS